MRQGHRSGIGAVAAVVAVLGLFGVAVFAGLPHSASRAPASARQPAFAGLGDTASPVPASAWQAARSATPAGAGSLVVTMRSEPRSFNPHMGLDFASHLIGMLLNARLVRINRVTQQLEPSLAEAYTCAADGLTCTLTLRKGVLFSDGTPFTAADVLFSFQLAYDDKTGSVLADALQPQGKRLTVTSSNAQTITVSFSAPYGPGLRILDGLPILPKHKFEAALKAGTVRQMWGPATPPAELAGLGPFVLQEYRAGERVVFVRNRRYWQKDATGAPLPRLDRLTIEIAPDQNAELLRLQSGQSDMTQSEIRADDYAILKREERTGKLKLIDAGLANDADAFWFNLKPAAKANDPRRTWLQSLELRKAVSHAVNRQAFANAVFLGAANPHWGPVSPSNTYWFPPAGTVEKHAYDLGKARGLLAKIGLTDTNRDGVLEDMAGQPVRFSLITQKGNTALEKGAGVIRDDLKALGIIVDVVPLEVGALVDRMLKANYDALYFRFNNTDTDPALAMGFWLSSGAAHVWNIDQPSPATAWEKEIDTVMQRMVAELTPATRQKLFYQAQKIFSDNLPVIYFALPRVYVAVSTRVIGATPAPVRPPILWNPEVVGVRR